MKLFRNVTIALGVAAFLISFTTLSHAGWGKSKDSQDHINTMRNAAAALQATNPDLAKDLNKYADAQEKKMDKMKKHWDAAMKDIKDSANALQASNPDLAKGLNDMADRKTKMMREGEKNRGKENLDGDIKLLRDSSAALQSTNGDLAGKLSKLGDKKEAMKRSIEEDDETEM